MQLKEMGGHKSSILQHYHVTYQKVKVPESIVMIIFDCSVDSTKVNESVAICHLRCLATSLCFCTMFSQEDDFCSLKKLPSIENGGQNKNG